MDGWMNLCICAFMYIRSLEAASAKLSRDVTGKCVSILDCDGVEIWQWGRGIDE